MQDRRHHPRCYQWLHGPDRLPRCNQMVDVNRWDEKAGLRRDAVRSQVIDVLEAQIIKETGNEEG